MPLHPLPTLAFRTWIATAGALGLLVGASLALVVWAGWREVTQVIGRISGATFALVLATSLACYGIRFLRWKTYLGVLGHRVPWSRSLEIFVAGLGLTWTPAKSGELLRGLFLMGYGVPFVRSVQLFYWDRLSDLAGMVLLALLATVAVASGYLILVPVAFAIVVAFWVLRPGGVLFSRAIALVHDRWRGPRWRWLEDLYHLQDGDRKFTAPLAAAGTLAGAVAFAMQAVGLVILGQASGVELGFASALLVTSVSTLAGAAVLLPAGAGVVETTSVGLLVGQGIAPSDAVAIGLLHRAATFWFAIALSAGAFAALFVRRQRA